MQGWLQYTLKGVQTLLSGVLIYFMADLVKQHKDNLTKKVSMTALYIVMLAALLINQVSIWIDPLMDSITFLREVEDVVHIANDYIIYVFIQIVLLTTAESIILVKDSYAITDRQLVKERMNKRKVTFLRLLIVLVIIDILVCVGVYCLDNVWHLKTGEWNEFFLPFFVQTILDVLIFACFIGYVILAGLNHYWFRRKYCNNKEVERRSMRFLWVCMMQCGTVALDWTLSYAFIFNQNPPDSAPYTLLVFQLIHDVFPFFTLIIPVWYIMKVHRNSFE
jgi:hypothetical protein